MAAYGEGTYGEGTYGVGAAPAGGSSYSSEVLADSPLGYWRLGDASGATVADSSGAARSMTATGTTTPGVPGLLSSSSDLARDFAGGWASVAAAAWMDVTQITVEAIFRADSVTGDRPLLTRTDWNGSDSDGAMRSFHLIVSGGRLSGQITGRPGPISVTLQSAVSSIVAGTTYHVALTWDNTTARLYLNGAEVASGAMAATQVATSGKPMAIGTDSVQHYGVFDGVIDEVAFYGTSLSSTRVAAHYAAMTASSGAVDGTLAATLPGLSANLSGGIEFSGAVAATLPALGANLAGTSSPPGVSGTLSASLPHLGASLAGAYSDAATLAAVLPPLAANLSGTYTPPPATGTLGALLPSLTANLAGQSFEPGVGGYLEALLPELSASFSADVLGRTGLGIGLDSDAVLTVVEALEPEPSVPAGTPPTVLHVIAPTVPVPTLVAGRPQ